MIKWFWNEGRFMNHNYSGRNYALAKAEADKIDEQIIETLKSGQSFLVEAGAGSGKTYSLKQAIKWIQENKIHEFGRNKQNVICITYTNAAVDVLVERLPKNTLIIPSTIHSFAWNAIEQYQGFLIKAVSLDSRFISDRDDSSKVTKVTYTLGHRYKQNGVQYLYHNDVLDLFCELLDNPKFRYLFSKRFPIILVDEYQDSYGPIIERFIKYFISRENTIQFGFFGDAWQTIYASNNACGEIEHLNLKVIKKNTNFRSPPRIVQLLNVIRPSLPQVSAKDGFQGSVLAITCEDYSGPRREDKNFRGELPEDVLQLRIKMITDRIRQITPAEDRLKVLMITHKVLAKQQDYEQLLDAIDNGLKNKEDLFLLFFMNTVEPAFKALTDSNMQLLFEILGINKYPINQKADKNKWMHLHEQLKEARTKKAIDVVRLIKETNLIPIPPQLDVYYHMYYNEPSTQYGHTTIQSFLNLDYSQFIAAINYLRPDAIFSTEHGVKGEEYENVVFVIGRGWIQYQFDTYVPMMTGQVDVPKKKRDAFERNRNLFYVCCSRPTKRLVLFVSVPVSLDFRASLCKMVGESNIITYTQFLDTQFDEEKSELSVERLAFPRKKIPGCDI